MVSGTGHVGQVSGNGLHLPHELIPHLGVVGVHVVGEVAHVQDGVIDPLLRLSLQSEGTDAGRE